MDKSDAQQSGLINPESTLFLFRTLSLHLYRWPKLLQMDKSDAQRVDWTVFTLGDVWILKYGSFFGKIPNGL